MGVSFSSLFSRMSGLFSRTSEVRILMLGLDSAYVLFSFFWFCLFGCYCSSPVVAIDCITMLKSTQCLEQYQVKEKPAAKINLNLSK